MTTKRARDFLAKELFVKHGIVTFRSLSRELGIHVNDAKIELQCYYDAVRDTDAPAVPTYLVSGEVPALTVNPHSDTQQSESAMDIDLEFEEHREEIDVVYQSKILLVDARTIDETKTQFSRIHSVHIYSLSPSRFGDAGLVCTPSFKVHKADANGGPEFFAVVGKMTGPHVKLRTGALNQSAASSSKTTLDAPAKVAPRLAGPAKAEQQTTKIETPSSTKAYASVTTSLTRAESKDRPKPSGKLDWSKAKTKEKAPITERPKVEKTLKIEPDPPAAVTDSSTSKKAGLEPKKQLVVKSEPRGVESGHMQKRGIKRKPLIDTDLESESEVSALNAKPSPVASSSIQKGVVYSDEDSDGEVRMLGKRRPKRKSAVTSDSEASLRAMMDIDDEQVDRVSRVGRAPPQREESEESEDSNEPERKAIAPPVTTEDEESDHVPVIQKRRKSRKVVPVGRNGLRKRRVIKSRMTTDAKGYMQTEDYSSYESVEDEKEAETKSKGKGKRKETKEASEPADKVEEGKPKAVAKEESAGKPRAKPPPKPRGGAPKRGSLLNFFGPERGKK